MRSQALVSRVVVRQMRKPGAEQLRDPWLHPAHGQRDRDRPGTRVLRDARLRGGQGATIALMTAMAATYAADRIRVNAVAPSLTDTPMARRRRAATASGHVARRKQPLAGEMMDPDEVAHAAVYFLSDESRVVTGQLLKIDGGWSVSPPRHDLPERPTMTLNGRLEGADDRRGRRLCRRGGLGRVDRRDRRRPGRRLGPAHRSAAVPGRHEHGRPRHLLRLLHARAQARKVVGGIGDDVVAALRAPRAGRRATEHLRRRDRRHLPRRAPQGRLGRPGHRSGRASCSTPSSRAPRSATDGSPSSSSRHEPDQRAWPPRSSSTPPATPTCAPSPGSASRRPASSIRPRR